MGRASTVFYQYVDIVLQILNVKAFPCLYLCKTVCVGNVTMQCCTATSGSTGTMHTMFNEHIAVTFHSLKLLLLLLVQRKEKKHPKSPDSVQDTEPKI